MLLDIDLPSGKRSYQGGARRADSRPEEGPNRGAAATNSCSGGARQIERELAGSRAPSAPATATCARSGSGGSSRRSSATRSRSSRYADQRGRIDTHAFRAGVRTRVRPWVGVVAMVLLTLPGVVGVVAGRGLGRDLGRPGARGRRPGLVDRVAPAGPRVLRVARRDPLHRRLPRADRRRRGRGSRPTTRPTCAPSRTLRAWFHASGAIATKIAPFVALALWPATNAPVWAAWVLLALGIVQIVTDVTLSTRSSDWKKFRRERRVARDRQAALSRF